MANDMTAFGEEALEERQDDGNVVDIAGGGDGVEFHEEMVNAKTLAA